MTPLPAEDARDEWSRNHPKATRRSPIPIPGITHGFGPTGKPSGYAQGCGCQECKDAKNEYERARNAAKPKAPRPEGGEVRDVFISVTYTPAEITLITRLAGEDGLPPAQWARTPIISILGERAGYTDTAPRYAPPAGRLTPTPGTGTATRSRRLGTAYTPHEITLIKQLAAEDDTPVDQWLRNPVLDILAQRAGYVDTARRKAPRRPNRKRQEGKQS